LTEPFSHLARRDRKSMTERFDHGVVIIHCTQQGEGGALKFDKIQSVMEAAGS
jgi:hypothetical protein